MESYLVGLVNLIVNLITIILIVHALLSFAPLEPWHPVRRFMHQLAEPLVRPFRNIVPQVGMFDFSIMVALIVFQIAGQLLVTLIRGAF